MELEDTAEGMASADYQERFIAEYQQLAIRMGRLDGLLTGYEEGTLDFEPSCPFALLADQYDAMAGYKACMLERARIEGIDLER